MGKISKETPQKVEYSEAIHEAAHATLSYLLDLPFRKILLNQPLHGGLMERSNRPIKDTNNRLEKEIIILLAGLFADLKFWHTKNPEINSKILGSSDSDIERAYDLCYFFSHDRSSFNETKYSELFLRSKTLVNSNYKIIKVLADELLIRKSMNYQQAIEVIKKAIQKERR